MRTRILLISLLALIGCPQAVAADFACRASDAEMRQAISEIHDKQSNVGLAAAIVHGDQLVFADYLGLADVEFDVPVDSNTKFGIASITKLYTAVALLQLRAQEQLALDDIVQKHVSDFPKKPEGEITLEMLALHKSGIPHPQSVRTPELLATHFATASDALSVFANEELQYVPGTDANYSSSNYNLIAAVVEQRSEQNFEDYVADNIFNELSLTETSFNNVLRPLPFRARRYSFYHPQTYEQSDELFLVPLWDYSFNTGGGNIIATASDVARFGAALSKPGVLAARELDLLQSSEWFGEIDDNGRTLIYVSGANPGLQAGLAILPESGIAATVLSNTWGLGSRSGEMTQLAKQLAELCDGPS